MTNPFLSEGTIDQIGRLRWLYHVTSAASLSDISGAGGLTSTEYRHELNSGRWGANEDLGSELVCLSMSPHWGMIKHQFRATEVVVLVFDASHVARLPGARLSPLNSAKRDARQFMTTPPADSDQVLSNCTADWASMREAEVLVPSSVPAIFLRWFIFFDTWARSEWLPSSSGDKPQELEGPPSIAFPDDYLSTRPRPD